MKISQNQVKAYWPEDPSQGLLTKKQWDEIARIVGFTSRESQVAKEFFAGKKRSDVATSLGVADSTIRHHLENVYSKLQVNSRIGVAQRLIFLRDRLTH